jgi:hypothetical protein
MRYIVSFAAIAALAFSYVYFDSQKSKKKEAKLAQQAWQERLESTAAPEPEVASPSSEPNVTSESAADPAKVAIEEEIIRIAPRSQEFNDLPDGDRQWVIEDTVRAYSAGQIQYGDLLDYIDQLSGVRFHKVYEREQPMFDPEVMNAQAESQEGGYQ